ncbi:MAG: DsrE family protein [Myxococcales bacterium]|nr:DsrE family protein [Myxococcales bacterium]
MAKLCFVLTTGPYQFQAWDTVSQLASAALDKGHEVSFFMYLDGVYNLIKHQKYDDLPVLPRDRFASLAKRGAKIVACGICTNARGLEGGKEYIEGAKVGGLPDFAEMVGEADRVVTF